MGRWPLVSLADLAAPGPHSLTTGPFGSAVASRYFRLQGVPLIRGSNLSLDVGTRLLDDDMVFLDEDKANEFARSVARRGDLVFTCWGTIGQVGLIDSRSRYDRYIVSNKQMKLTPDPARVDSLYLYYALSSPSAVAGVQSIAIGSSVPGFNLGQLKQIQISLPPLPVQRAIAEVLGVLDDKIDANGSVIRVVRELLAALFDSVMLTGEDEDWRMSTLAEELEVLEIGKRPAGGVAKYTSGVPSLGAESVVALAAYDYSKTKHVPREFFDAMTRGICQDLDVLLYKDGGRPGEFEPHVSLLGYGFPYDVFCINEHVYRLRVRAPLTQEFLYCWLSSEPVLEEMRRRGTGVAIPGLNSTAVKGLPIKIPKEPVMKRFSETAHPLVLLALSKARESRILADLRDALLPPLMSMELSVRDAESLVGEAV